MQNHFQSKLISSANTLIYFVTAQAKGKAAWFYVQVDEPKYNAFKKQLTGGAMNLADFGAILHSGWGTAAPEPIRALMEDLFSEAA
jgi:hypothetical protein